MACGPSQAELEKQRQLDSIRVADSLKREAAIQREKDSIEWYSFTSKDLAFFELHGHVKTLNFGYFIYEFDENGNLIKCNGYNPFKVYNHPDPCDDSSLSEVPLYKRNRQGYITSSQNRCDNNYVEEDEFRWENERVKVHSCIHGDYGDNLTCEYDENGRLVKAQGNNYYRGFTVKTYTYLEDDKYGNWIKRRETFKITAPELNDKSSEVVTRSITYYPFNTTKAPVENAITKGVYQITKGTLARDGAGENAKVATYWDLDEQATKKLYLEPGEFVETTGRVKDGYAEVEEHLIDDTSEYRYGKTWVPVENLKKIEKCNHAHLLRDGLL